MATLKISDLSVGDWVEASGMAKRVHNIEFQNGEYFVHFSDPDTNSEDYLHAPFIGPIPITAKTLKKNGFESTTKSNVFTLTHGKLQLYVSKELDGWTMSFVNFTERLCILQVIRKSYIHELQHALRLAGVDKEINL